MPRRGLTKAQKKMIEVFMEWRRDKDNIPEPTFILAEIKKHMKLLGAKQSTVDAIPAQPTSPQDSQCRLLTYWDLVHNEARLYGAANYPNPDLQFWPGLMRNIGRILECFRKAGRGFRNHAKKIIDMEQARKAMLLRFKAELAEKFEGGATRSELVGDTMELAAFANSLGEREKINPVIAAGKAARVQ